MCYHHYRNLDHQKEIVIWYPSYSFAVKHNLQEVWFHSQIDFE